MNTAFSPSGVPLFRTMSPAGIYEGGMRVLPGMDTRNVSGRLAAMRHVAHFPTRMPAEWEPVIARAEIAQTNRNRRHDPLRHGVVRVITDRTRVRSNLD
jgi:hypothetical protein